MKVGIIRCLHTEDMCPGTGNFKTIQNKTGVFTNIEEDIEIIGFNTCGGCPGKKAVSRAKEMIKRGADTIVFASCISKGTPIGYACPFAETMKTAVKENIQDTILILEYSH